MSSFSSSKHKLIKYILIIGPFLQNNFSFKLNFRFESEIYNLSNDFIAFRDLDFIKNCRVYEFPKIQDNSHRR